MTDDDGNELITVNELADRWRISRTAVRRRIENGTLPAIDTNPGGERKVYRIKLTDVQRIEQAGHVPTED